MVIFPHCSVPLLDRATKKVPGWTLEVFMNFRLDGAGITELKMNLRTNCASRDRGQVFFLRKTHGRGSLGRVQTVQSMPSWG